MTYRLTRRARRDVSKIWAYIATDSESAADRLLSLLTYHFQMLGDFPQAGTRRDELRPGYRAFPVGEYMILYRIAKPGIQILHIVHGKMDLNSYQFGS